jgi:hypothetical protein
VAEYLLDHPRLYASGEHQTGRAVTQAVEGHPWESGRGQQALKAFRDAYTVERAAIGATEDKARVVQ